MSAFLSWYLTVTFLSWLTFPLAHSLFPALADRGYTLSRVLGLLLWGYAFWLMASLGVAQNDMGGLLLGLTVLIGLNLWIFFKHRSEILDWLRSNLRLIITTEILFLTAFGLLTIFRAANPEIVGTEKPMELLFINAILRSPTFPPRDTWLSGYAISYYHFGYILTAMLAMFTGIPGTMAFNLMLALVFGLSAIAAYGILYNLLAIRESVSEDRKPSVGFPLFGPLFLLLVSNLEGFLEVLHRRGLFWSGTKNFWTWLDIKELRDAPTLPLGWIPDRFWWWWRASRVIMDYDLTGQWTGDVISEFPAFSYILGDLHPHVLAMPFGLLAVGSALNLYAGGWRGEMKVLGIRLYVSKAEFFFAALLLGGLAFLNTWDILIAAALIVFAYTLARVREAGWDWERIEDLLLLGLSLGITAFVLYVPFYVGFSSQAGGIIPNFPYPTRGTQLWVMFGSLFIPLFIFLIYLWRGEKMTAGWGKGIGVTLGILFALIGLMFLLGFLALKLKPDVTLPFLQSQNRDASTFLADSIQRRLTYVGGLLTLLALLTPSLAFLVHSERRLQGASSSLVAHSSYYVLLLIALGALLVLAPEFVYLRDQFGYRINTVFKFYYQAWILWSVAAAYGTVVLLRKLRGVWNWIFGIGLILLLIAALTYPALGIFNKTNNFNPPFGWTLDDFDRVRRENPDEAAAIMWLKSAPDGIVAEAIGGQYSAYGRIAIYTGLPTVLGWPGHEGQWRGNYEVQGSRQQDIETLYTTPDWAAAQSIIRQYDIHYIYIGSLERSTYRVNENKFQQFLHVAYRQGNVIVYEVP